MPESQLISAFTVDVEDYYQVSAFEGQVDRHSWGRFENRVVVNTRRLLRLLEAYDIRATFFVLGWVAWRFPHLVREIHQAGHELGSHSFWHRLVYQLTPEQFRQDLIDSRAAIEDVTGEPVRAFRAASFSITRRSLWALAILAQEGFEVDSSISPILHDRYGIPGATPHLHRQQTPHGTLWEFPTSVRTVGVARIPVSGGGYFRLYPIGFTCNSLQRINERGEPFVFYVHPWEIDPEQPRLRAGSWLSRQRHYLNLASTERKLHDVLRSFRFGTLGEAIAARRATVAGKGKLGTIARSTA